MPESNTQSEMTGAEIFLRLVFLLCVMFFAACTLHFHDKNDTTMVVVSVGAGLLATASLTGEIVRGVIREEQNRSSR